MASIIRPDFKHRLRSAWSKGHGFSKKSRREMGLPYWAPWCFVAVLLLVAFYVSSGVSHRMQLQPRQIASGAVSIEVIDGDTVRSNGRSYRLVGFNTPESGLNAHCSSERALSAKATDRLQQLLDGGIPNLQRTACACKPGTEGTRRCNYGRLCGRLTVDGRDVGSILIAEGLAERFECRATSCPRRRDWCRH
jgi:endonuclease YncB( thermonuclease family)